MKSNLPIDDRIKILYNCCVKQCNKISPFYFWDHFGLYCLRFDRVVPLDSYAIQFESEYPLYGYGDLHIRFPFIAEKRKKGKMIN